MVGFIYSNWNQLLCNLGQPRLSRTNLAKFADAIDNKGAALDNCWGFVDGTVRPVARPGKDQRILYNGQKKIHSIKFQSVATPNGLVANLFGPVEGKRHDSSMLAASGSLNELQQHSWSPHGNMCIYGDPAYLLRPQLQSAFKGYKLLQCRQHETDQ